MVDVKLIRLGVLLMPVISLAGCAAALTWDGPSEPERSHVEGSEPVVASRPLQREEYLVQSGDTMYSIAFRNQLDFRELAGWNGVGDDFLIRPGQILRLSPPPILAPTVPEDDRVNTVSIPVPPPVGRPAPLPPGPIGGGLPSAPGQIATAPVMTTPAPTRGPAPASVEAAAAPVLSAAGWTWPTAGAIERGFDPNKGSKGLFFTGKLGQPVVAAAPGRVVYSGNALRGYGELVIVKHDEVHLSAYGHNRRRLVKEGDEVKVGQMIAEMGEGPERRPLLHFEIRERGQPVNPARFLPTAR